MRARIKRQQADEFLNDKRNNNGVIVLTQSAWKRIPKHLKRFSYKGLPQVGVSGKFEDIIFDRSLQQETKEMNYQTDWFIN